MPRASPHPWENSAARARGTGCADFVDGAGAKDDAAWRALRSIHAGPTLQVAIGVAKVVSELVDHGLADLGQQLAPVGELLFQRPLEDDQPVQHGLGVDRVTAEG